MDVFVRPFRFSRKWCARAVFACAFLALHVRGADRATVTLTLGWDANPEPDVVGYVVYYGGASLEYTNSVFVSSPIATLDGLREGATYFFAVAAWTQSGFQSPPSDELSYTIPVTGPRLDIDYNPGQTVRVRFESLPGRTHELQVSTDLQTWTTLSISPPATESQAIEFSDLTGGGFERRFYRLIVR